MTDRIAILEARQVLLVRVLRQEMSAEEFEARWNAVAHEDRLPPRREIAKPGCTCAECVARYEHQISLGLVERPIL